MDATRIHNTIVNLIDRHDYVNHNSNGDSPHHHHDASKFTYMKRGRLYMKEKRYEMVTLQSSFTGQYILHLNYWFHYYHHPLTSSSSSNRFLSSPQYRFYLKVDSGVDINLLTSDQHHHHTQPHTEVDEGRHYKSLKERPGWPQEHVVVVHLFDDSVLSLYFETSDLTPEFYFENFTMYLNRSF